MAETRPATALTTTATYSLSTDYFMILRGNGAEPTSGPFLLQASSVVGTGGGDGETTVINAPVQTVFGREGDVAAAANDYSAALISYSNASSGLPATTVQAAVDAVAAASGTLPVATSETHVLTLDGNLLPAWAAQVMQSVNGRSGAVVLQAGDMDASMITDTASYKIMTAAERTKLGLLNTARQVPDPTGVTDDYVLTASGGAYSWAAPTGGGGGGGSISQIDLLARATPVAASPPTQVYAAGCGVWSFSQSGADELRGEFRWPGGTPTLKVIYSMESATSGNIGWTLAIMAMTPGDAASIETDSFDAANTTAAQAVAGTAGHPKEVSHALTNTDSVAAGDYVRWSLKRNTGVASNATGAARPRCVDIVFA